MKILVDINHPAHVHFFKNFIREARAKGHELTITASDKDVACRLLDAYGFTYVRLGSYGDSILKKVLNIPVMDYRMYRVARHFRPDVMVGLASFRAAHAAFVLRKPCFIFDDTEHRKENLLYLPFARQVYTPSCFRDNLGRKQIRYEGYHELAYLHPDYFTPDPQVLEEEGLSPGERFTVVRFVSWHAGHDIGAKGFTLEGKRRLIGELREYGKVVITAEGDLPPEFQSCAMRTPPERIHDLLSFAALYIGEGGTMASEAVALGVPAIFVSSLGAGTFDEQENKYGLMCSFTNGEDGIRKAVELLKMEGMSEEWQQKRARMLAEKVDVTAFIVDVIENLTI